MFQRSVLVVVPLELMSWGLEILPGLDIAISGFRVLVLCRNLTDDLFLYTSCEELWF